MHRTMARGVGSWMEAGEDWILGGDWVVATGGDGSGVVMVMMVFTYSLCRCLCGRMCGSKLELLFMSLSLLVCVSVCVIPDRDVRFYLSPFCSKANLWSQMFSLWISFKDLWWESKRTDWAEKQRPVAGSRLASKKSLRTRDLRDSIEIKRYLRDLNSFSLFLMRSLQYSIGLQTHSIGLIR